MKESNTHPPSECQKFQDEGLFELYHCDSLDEENKKTIEEALLSCSKCRDYYEGIKNMDTFIHESFVGESISDLEDRVVRAFRQSTSRSPVLLRRFSKIAACLAMAILIGAIVEHGDTLNIAKITSGHIPEFSVNRDQVSSTSELKSRLHSRNENSRFSSRGRKQSFDGQNNFAYIDFDTMTPPPEEIDPLGGQEGYLHSDSDESHELLDSIDSLEFYHQLAGGGGGDVVKRPAEDPSDSWSSISNYETSKGKKDSLEAWSRKRVDQNGKMEILGDIFLEDTIAEEREQLKRKPTFKKEEQASAVRASSTSKQSKNLTSSKEATEKSWEDKTEHDEEMYIGYDPKKPLTSPGTYRVQVQDHHKKIFSEATQKQLQSKTQNNPMPTGLKLVRTGQASFEVDSYKSTVKNLAKIAHDNEGYIASENSSRQKNGKMKGTLTFKIKAENFTTFMANLRGIGELIHQDVRVQDVTKQYFDTRANIDSLEKRKDYLLKALEERKGNLKDYVEFESKLAEVLEKINQAKGNLKYLSHQVSYSTLYLTLIETGLNSASTVVHKENASMHIAVKDAHSAYQEAKKRAKDLSANLIHSRTDQGKSPVQTKIHLTFQAKSSAFDELISALGALGHVTKLDRRSDDKSDNGKTPGINVLREEGIGTLKLTFYHLKTFVVEKNQMVVWVKNIPEVYRQVSDMSSPSFKITNKDIDSFTDKAKSCRFKLEIDKKDYSEFAARLRSFGKVHVENGKPILPRTASGEELPSFQKQIVSLSINFKTLEAILTDTLTIKLDSENVQNTFHSLKSEIRKRGFKFKELKINEESPRATRAEIRLELNADKYDSFLIHLTQNKEPLGYVSSKNSWSLSDSPEKLKDIPDFQERKATINIHINKLMPSVVYRQGFFFKVNNVQDEYLRLKKLARDFEGAHVKGSAFNANNKQGQFTIVCAKNNIDKVIENLKTNFSGKIKDLTPWEIEEDPNNPLPLYRKKVAEIVVHLTELKPRPLKIAKIKLYSKQPSALLKQATDFTMKNGELKHSELKDKEDYTRECTLIAQTEEKDYERFVDFYKKLVDDGDLLDINENIKNLNDPQFKEAWIVGSISLTITNSKKGALAPGGPGGYFAKTWDRISRGFFKATDFLFVGLSFIAPFLVLFWLIKRLIKSRKQKAA